MKTTRRLLGICLKICKNGHAYNGDDYQSCPTCGA